MSAPPTFLIDTTVVTYAFGADHPLREPCRRMLALAGAGTISLAASVEVIQEFAFHRTRQTTAAQGVAESRILLDALHLYPFDSAVLEHSLTLMTTHSIRGKDAVHAATALVTGFDAIVTADQDFDGVPGLRRIDPSEFAAELTAPPG